MLKSFGESDTKPLSLKSVRDKHISIIKHSCTSLNADNKRHILSARSSSAGTTNEVMIYQLSTKPLIQSLPLLGKYRFSVMGEVAGNRSPSRKEEVMPH
jgi:hypothetical protein